MDIGTISAPLELKFAGDKSRPGSFEGYGAVFNNIDRGGDIIEPGAFTKTLNDMMACGVGSVPMYQNHDRAAGAIGVWDEFSEDGKGLHVKGRLIGMDTETGKWNYARLREGAIKGMSIGYRVPAGGSTMADVKGKRCRKLKSVELSEVSLVDDPMNPEAKFNFVKSLTGAYDVNPRELERDLRDAGLSRTHAKIAVGLFQKSFRRDAGEADDILRDEANAAAVLKEHMELRLKEAFAKLTTKG